MRRIALSKFKFTLTLPSEVSPGLAHTRARPIVGEKSSVCFYKGPRENKMMTECLLCWFSRFFRIKSVVNTTKCTVQWVPCGKTWSKSKWSSQSNQIKSLDHRSQSGAGRHSNGVIFSSPIETRQAPTSVHQPMAASGCINLEWLGDRKASWGGN